MRKLIGVALLAGLMCLPAGVGWGQRTVGRDTGRDTGRGASSGVINYSDLSSRQTRRTDREDRQKKEAEEAKKKAEEQRREKERADRMKRWQDERGQRPGGSTTASSNNRQTTGSRTAGNNPNGRGGREGKSATAPVTTGGSYDPTTREVTEVMLDAIKTRHVQFDPEEARENPSMILLNAPRSDPNQRRRATDTGIARPL